MTSLTGQKYTVSRKSKGGKEMLKGGKGKKEESFPRSRKLWRSTFVKMQAVKTFARRLSTAEGRPGFRGIAGVNQTVNFMTGLHHAWLTLINIVPRAQNRD